MTDIVMCRVCLADNIRMHAIASTPYQEMFEKLTTTKFLTGDGLPATVCYLCASQLQKFCRFFKLSQITEKLLTKLVQDGIQLTHATIPSLERGNMHTYSMSSIQCMTVPEDFEGDNVEEETLPEVINKEEASDFDLDIVEEETLPELNIKEEPSNFDLVILEETLPEVNIKEEASDFDLDIVEENTFPHVNDKEEASDFDLGIVEEETLPEVNIKEEASNLDTSEIVFEDGIEEESTCSYANPSVDDLKSDPEGANTMTPSYQNSDMSHKLCSIVVYQPKFTADSSIENQPSSRLNQPRSIVNHPRSKVNQPQLTALSSRVNQPKTAQSSLAKCTSQRNQKTPVTSKNETRELSITKSSVKSSTSHFNETEDNQLVIGLKRTAGKSKTCELCHKTLSTSSKLKAHVIKIHIEGKQFECNICKKTFRLKKELKNHSKEHPPDKPFACLVCSEKFAKKFALETHMRIHTKKQLFSCDLCSMKFMCKSKLITHARTHTDEKPFGCKTCSKRFTSRNSLNMHMQTHTGQKFACYACDKSFIYKSSLKLHVKICSEKETLNKDCTRKHVDCAPYDFECDLCSKVLNSKDCLSKHMEKHTGLTCDICNRTFKKKQNLRNHILSHMGLKQIHLKYRLTQLLKTCTGQENTNNTSSIVNQPSSKVNQSKTAESSLSKCTNEAIQKTPLSPKKESSELSITKSSVESLKSHLNHTEDTKPYISLKRKAIRGTTCEWCHKIFSTNSSLRAHVIRIHIQFKPFECDICNKKFRQKIELNNHVKVHTRDKPFECPVCSEKFAKYYTLETHIRVHTRQRLLSCNLCSMKFTCKSKLKIHARTHTGEKPFACETCSKTFSYRNQLNMHMKTHTGEKLACNVCDRSFICKNSLKLHVKTHSEKENFKKDCNRKHVDCAAYDVECDLCGKVLNSKHCFSKHMEKHTGLTCDICNRTFKKKHNLRIHVISHMELKPHTSMLGKEYTSNTGIQSFTCDRCDHTYNKKHDLIKHMILHDDTSVIVTSADCFTN